MEAFYALLAFVRGIDRSQVNSPHEGQSLCAGNSSVTGEFPSQTPVTRSFDLLFDLHLNNGWVNNHKTGNWWRQLAHYDVSVMEQMWYE